MTECTCSDSCLQSCTPCHVVLHGCNDCGAAKGCPSCECAEGVGLPNDVGGEFAETRVDAVDMDDLLFVSVVPSQEVMLENILPELNSDSGDADDALLGTSDETYFDEWDDALILDEPMPTEGERRVVEYWCEGRSNVNHDGILLCEVGPHEWVERGNGVQFCSYCQGVRGIHSWRLLRIPNIPDLVWDGSNDARLTHSMDYTEGRLCSHCNIVIDEDGVLLEQGRAPSISLGGGSERTPVADNRSN